MKSPSSDLDMRGLPAGFTFEPRHLTGWFSMSMPDRPSAVNQNPEKPRVRESSLGDIAAGQDLAEKTENPLPTRETP